MVISTNNTRGEFDNTSLTALGLALPKEYGGPAYIKKWGRPTPRGWGPNDGLQVNFQPRECPSSGCPVRGPLPCDIRREGRAMPCNTIPCPWQVMPTGWTGSDKPLQSRKWSDASQWSCRRLSVVATIDSCVRRSGPEDKGTQKVPAYNDDVAIEYVDTIELDVKTPALNWLRIFGNMTTSRTVRVLARGDAIIPPLLCVPCSLNTNRVEHMILHARGFHCFRLGTGFDESHVLLSTRI